MTELNLPLEAQLRGFLLAAAAGVLLGALYDVLRVYRILFRPPKGLVFALDVFTLCAAAIVTFLTSLAASRGVLRFYLFLGEAAGWAAYASTVGRVTVFLARGLLRLLERLVFRPLRRLRGALRAAAGRACRAARDLWKKIAPRRKKALKPDGDVVYNRDSFSRQAKRSRMTDRKGGEQRAGYRNKRKEKAARQSPAENRDRRILPLHGGRAGQSADPDQREDQPVKRGTAPAGGAER